MKYISDCDRSMARQRCIQSAFKIVVISSFGSENLHKGIAFKPSSVKDKKAEEGGKVRREGCSR